jgi:hypothetical protein
MSSGMKRLGRLLGFGETRRTVVSSGRGVHVKTPRDVETCMSTSAPTIKVSNLQRQSQLSASAHEPQLVPYHYCGPSIRMSLTGGCLLLLIAA